MGAGNCRRAAAIGRAPLQDHGQRNRRRDEQWIEISPIEQRARRGRAPQ
jgi:hypothetical protein